MESKFKPGDKVRVINYGHPSWFHKENYYKMQEHMHNTPNLLEIMLGLEYKLTTYIRAKPTNIIWEDDDRMTLDISPELVGQEGIVEGSYNDLYPQYSDKKYEEQYERNNHQYSVKGIPYKSAWYDEQQLELI